MRARSYLWLGLPMLALVGCSPSEVEVLQKLPMPMSGQQMTVQAAFADHANCRNVSWKAFDERTVTKVKVTCEVKDLDPLREHLVNLEQTADRQALERFQLRKEQSIHELKRSIEVLTQRIESAKEKTFEFKPLESLPKYDRYRLNCDEYAEKARHPQQRIERNESYVAKFCTEGSKTYHKQFCEQARQRYNEEVPRLKARIADYMRDQANCQKQRADDRERLQAINEERAQRVKEAEARHAELIKSYEAEVSRKQAELVEAQNRTTDAKYDLDKVANAKLDGLNKIKSLSLQFIFRTTVDKKEAILESVSSKLTWSGYDAPLHLHQPKHPVSYDGNDIVGAMIQNRKVWSCEDAPGLCRKIDNTLIPIYIMR